MEDMVLNQLEVAPALTVLQAARDFAAALVETPQYQAFEQASEQVRTDTHAQNVVQAYQAKQRSLQGVMMLNALGKEDQEELEHLREQFLTQPSVVEYNQAQAALVAMCQASGDLLSQSIGLDFAAACKTGGCCG